MAEQDMSMDIKINGAETAANTVERLTEIMGQFGGSLAVASGLVGQLEESLRAFKSIDASTLKNLKEISKLNSVVADAKWTETHEKYQRAKYDTGGASTDVEYKRWQTEKLRREEEFKRTELGKQREEARAKKEIETLELAVEKERAKIEEMKTKNIARALANQKKEEGIEKKKASRYDNSLGQSILYGLKGYEERVAAQRNLTGYLGRGLGNLLKDTKVGNIFGGGIAGKGINLGTIIPAITGTIASQIYNQMIKPSLEAAREVESLRTSLGVVTGSSVTTDNLFSQLKDYSLISPFGIKQTTEMGIFLKQSGIFNSELMDKLKRLGDISGGNEEKLSRIANNYAQIVANDRATALDLRQFANAGIPIFAEIKNFLNEDSFYKEKFGKSQFSTKDIKALTTKGEISADIIEKVINRMTSKGGTFYGATAKGAETIKSQLLNHEEKKTLTKAAWGEVFYNIGMDESGKSMFQKYYK